MLTTTEALVLRTTRYDDRSMIVDMLCRSGGRLAFMVRLSPAKRAGVQNNLFQPMTLLEVVFDLRQTQHLQRLRQVRLEKAYADIPFNVGKTAVSLFLAEFLCHASRHDNGQSPEMFAFIRYSMEWLDAAREGYANFHITFITHLMRFLGFFPEVETYGDGCLFDLREGIFTPAIPMHPDYLSAVDTQHMVNILRLQYATMHRFRLSQSQRNQALDTLLRYCRLHIPSFPELKGLEVLREVFGS